MSDKKRVYIGGERPTVGDVIICEDDSQTDRLKKGDTYHVKLIHPEGSEKGYLGGRIRLEEVAGSYSYYPKRFRLTHPHVDMDGERLHVGDLVVRLEVGSCPELQKAAVYTVECLLPIRKSSVPHIKLAESSTGGGYIAKHFRKVQPADTSGGMVKHGEVSVGDILVRSERDSPSDAFPAGTVVEVTEIVDRYSSPMLRVKRVDNELKTTLLYTHKLNWPAGKIRFGGTEPVTPVPNIEDLVIGTVLRRITDNNNNVKKGELRTVWKIDHDSDTILFSEEKTNPYKFTPTYHTNWELVSVPKTDGREVDGIRLGDHIEYSWDSEGKTPRTGIVVALDTTRWNGGTCQTGHIIRLTDGGRSGISEGHWHCLPASRAGVKYKVLARKGSKITERTTIRPINPMTGRR